MGAGHIVITILDGEQKGVAFKFDKTPITIGRHEDDDVYLIFDNTVSRHHARITEECDSYFIEDVGPEGRGSTNGTYLNDETEKLSTKTAIKSGDVVRIGSTPVKFEAS
ncbi:FHA domain-containing protein [Chloroflexota bacterium]